eukprot:jgi/Undpi1/9701/HiC_scaffold_27.g12157.m1
MAKFRAPKIACYAARNQPRGDSVPLKPSNKTSYIEGRLGNLTAFDTDLHRRQALAIVAYQEQMLSRRLKEAGLYERTQGSLEAEAVPVVLPTSNDPGIGASAIASCCSITSNSDLCGDTATNTDTIDNSANTSALNRGASSGDIDAGNDGTNAYNQGGTDKSFYGIVFSDIEHADAYTRPFGSRDGVGNSVTDNEDDGRVGNPAANTRACNIVFADYAIAGAQIRSSDGSAAGENISTGDTNTGALNDTTTHTITGHV